MLCNRDIQHGPPPAPPARRSLGRSWRVCAAGGQGQGATSRPSQTACTHTAHAAAHNSHRLTPKHILTCTATPTFTRHIRSHTLPHTHIPSCTIARTNTQAHALTSSRTPPCGHTVTAIALILTGTRALSAPCAVPGQPRPREMAGPLGAASEPAPRPHPHPGAPRTPDRVKGCPMPAGTTAKAPGPEPRIPGSHPTSGAQPPLPAQAPPRTPSQREHLLPWGLTLRGASDGKDAGAVSTSD